MRTCLTHLLLSPALFILFVLAYFYHWIIASLMFYVVYVVIIGSSAHRLEENQ
jgi:hypothetical protein